MLNSNVMLTFFALDPKYPFFGKFALKYRNCCFRLQFSTETNLKMKNSIVMFTFSVLLCKYTFYANFLQNIKIFISSSNFVLRLISICTVQQRSSLAWFRPKILFSSKFGLKKENCCFKPKFYIWTNLNMQNSTVIFTFSIPGSKYSFQANFLQNKRNCDFKLKFRIQTNMNQKNSIAMFSFPVFVWKYLFWENFVPQVKIDLLR